MGHTKHLWRAVLLLIMLGGGSIVGRHFLIPQSFGESGFYRYDSLYDYMKQPISHGGNASCTPCHEELAGMSLEGSMPGCRASRVTRL